MLTRKNAVKESARRYLPNSRLPVLETRQTASARPRTSRMPAATANAVAARRDLNIRTSTAATAGMNRIDASNMFSLLAPAALKHLSDQMCRGFEIQRCPSETGRSVNQKQFRFQ